MYVMTQSGSMLLFSLHAWRRRRVRGRRARGAANTSFDLDKLRFCGIVRGMNEILSLMMSICLIALFVIELAGSPPLPRRIVLATMFVIIMIRVASRLVLVLPQLL